MTSPRLSILTATCGGEELVREYLRTLRETLGPMLDSGEAEVILIDDASTDGTPELLRRLEPPFRVFLNQHREGFARNNNRAALEARGEILALLNPDLELTPDWYEPMRARLDLPGTGFVGNVQTRVADGRIDHAGITFDCFGIPVHAGQGSPRISRRGARLSPAVTAACCLVTRANFLAHGGFDEGYRNGYEDIDLCLRMGEAGLVHRVALESRVRHHVSVSPGRKDAEDINRLRFLRRWQAETGPRGLREWPKWYLVSRLSRPWTYNGGKLFDCLLRIAGLRSGLPAWARVRAEALARTIAALPEPGAPTSLLTEP